MLLVFSLFNLLSYLSQAHAYYNDSFHEELMLKPLPSGHVYAYFQFTTFYDAPNYIDSFQHTHLFPHGLAEIISRHQINELHVSLTEGFWNYEKYGYPFFDSAPGAEIYAWFNHNVTNIDKEWKGLTNALSGLLCASFNFVDKFNSLSPEFTFRPTDGSRKYVDSKYLRYSSLPRETVCTENLTPFKKLLPCDSSKGLAYYFHSAFIHNTNYHSTGIHFRTKCSNPECLNPSLELKQTVSLIYDITGTELQDWSVRKLFGYTLHSFCPLAKTSKIYVDITSNGTIHTYQLSPEPDSVVTSIRGGQENKFAVYDLKANDGTCLVQAYHTSHIKPGLSYPSILYTNRYIIGYGQERGSLVTKLYNNYWQPLDIVLLENVPWYLPLYLHTAKILSGGKNIKPIMLRYIPGRERRMPYYLELVLRLPPHSVTKFSVEVDYTFLKWQEYPPDANHGFYMGPAVITAFLPTARNYTATPLDGSTISSIFNATRDNYLVQLRTEIVLINLPTPDFSMPYNVICLACTAVALAFGPLHNITTKRLVLKTIEEEGVKGKLKRFYGKLRGWFGKEKTE